MTRPTRSALAAIFFSLALGAAGPSAAQTAPACAGAKLDASAVAMAETMGCYGYAAGRGLSLDPACISRAEGRLGSLFTWIEAQGGCEATADVGTYETRIATCAGLFADGATAWSRQPCLGAKLVASGAAAGAGLACFADAARDAVPPPASCLADAEHVLASAFDLAARRGRCRDVSDLPSFLADLAACLEPFAPEPPIEPVACGDTAGEGGTDVPCTCGDEVVTDTVLGATDPILAAPCLADGLVVGDGVTLDLGENTLRGSGPGVGVAPGVGATVRNGTVDGFGTGLDATEAAILADLAVTGSAGHGILVRAGLAATSVEVAGSGGSGIWIDSDAAVTLLTCNVHGGAGSGIHAVSAPDLLVSDCTVHGNGGDGVVLGDVALQTGAVVAKIERSFIRWNAIGIRVEQKDAAVAATAAALFGNKVHDNAAQGLLLKTSYQLIETEEGSGRLQPFRANEIFHNGMSDDGCASPQTHAQVEIVGPVAVSAALASHCGDAGDQMTCQARAEDACYWTGTTCVNTWDLRGSVGCDPVTAGNANAIHSYNTTTDNSEKSVGMYAETGAFVWADNNRWREPVSNFTDNVDQASGAFVDADSNCGGTELSCVAAPPPP